MILLNQIGGAVRLVTLTLCLQGAALIEWLKPRQAWANSLGHARSGIDGSNCRSARAGILWASLCRSRSLPSWELAFYFSASSYSTVGYGDVLLPSSWRLLGPLESITGVLMCGISVSVLFALVTQLFDRDPQSARKKEHIDTLLPVSAGASTNSREQSHA
jgi:voltage-gated potassium channel